jgi:hypothetical protein
MSNKTMTALQWLEDNIDSGMPYREILILIEQAKQMEKQQIIDAFEKAGLDGWNTTSAEYYYNETFKTKP